MPVNIANSVVNVSKIRYEEKKCNEKMQETLVNQEETRNGDCIEIPGSFLHNKSTCNSTFMVRWFFVFLLLQFERAAKNVCEMARSIGCGGMEGRAFEEKKSVMFPLKSDYTNIE